MKLHRLGSWSWLQYHADDAPTEEEEEAYYAEMKRIEAEEIDETARHRQWNEREMARADAAGGVGVGEDIPF